jgi:hypothetical protein
MFSNLNTSYWAYRQIQDNLYRKKIKKAESGIDMKGVDNGKSLIFIKTAPD